MQRIRVLFYAAVVAAMPVCSGCAIGNKGSSVSESDFSSASSENRSLRSMYPSNQAAEYSTVGYQEALPSGQAAPATVSPSMPSSGQYSQAEIDYYNRPQSRPAYGSTSPGRRSSSCGFG